MHKTNAYYAFGQFLEGAGRPSAEEEEMSRDQSLFGGALVKASGVYSAAYHVSHLQSLLYSTTFVCLACYSLYSGGGPGD